MTDPRSGEHSYFHRAILYLTQTPQISKLPPHPDAKDGSPLDRLLNRYLNETLLPRSLAIATLQMVNRRCCHLRDYDLVAVEYEYHHDLPDRCGRSSR